MSTTRSNPNTMEPVSKIGQHIPLVGTVADTLLIVKNTTDKGITIQTFLSNGSTLTAPTMSEVNRKHCRGIVRSHKIKYYVHAPYTINFCTMMNPDKGYVQKCAQQYLKLSFDIEALGVVFHVGKSVKLEIKKALNAMTLSLMHLCKFAKRDCPILLETPAGQGTELLVGYASFSAYYKYIQPHTDSRMKVCIDTCHVFAGGDDPLEYITKWILEHGADSIGLVHFNDSKTPRGSRKDRHEPFLSGNGHIGIDTMMSIARLCADNDIHMVTE